MWNLILHTTSSPNRNLSKNTGRYVENTNTKSSFFLSSSKINQYYFIIFLRRPILDPRIPLMFNMAECRPAPFPFLLGINLEEGFSTPPMDCTIYRQLIGSLLYLTHSRPDICYAVNVVSRYMQQPHDIHWKKAKRIL